MLHTLSKHAVYQTDSMLVQAVYAKSQNNIFRSPNPLPRGLRPSPQTPSALSRAGAQPLRLSLLHFGILDPSQGRDGVFIGWRIGKTFIIYYHAKTLGYGVKPQIA